MGNDTLYSFYTSEKEEDVYHDDNTEIKSNNISDIVPVCVINFALPIGFDLKSKKITPAILKNLGDGIRCNIFEYLLTTSEYPASIQDLLHCILDRDLNSFREQLAEFESVPGASLSNWEKCYLLLFAIYVGENDIFRYLIVEKDYGIEYKYIRLLDVAISAYYINTIGYSELQHIDAILLSTFEYCLLDIINLLALHSSVDIYANSRYALKLVDEIDSKRLTNWMNIITSVRQPF